jgi:hypothetical protein
LFRGLDIGESNAANREWVKLPVVNGIRSYEIKGLAFGDFESFGNR